MKTPENQKFSGVFRGYKMGTLARNGLRSKLVKNFLRWWTEDSFTPCLVPAIDVHQ